MALWQAKGMGVLFGGVTDEDRDEETLESVFHRDLSVYLMTVRCLQLTKCRFGYQVAGKGRWLSLGLKKPKKKGTQGAKKKKKPQATRKGADFDDEAGSDNETEAAPVIDPVSVSVLLSSASLSSSTIIGGGGSERSGPHDPTSQVQRDAGGFAEHIIHVGLVR
jgi:hypothetical protein